MNITCYQPLLDEVLTVRGDKAEEPSRLPEHISHQKKRLLPGDHRCTMLE